MSISQTKLGLLRDSIILLITRLNKNSLIVHLHGNNLGNVLEETNSFLRKIFFKALQNVDVAIALGKRIEDNYKKIPKTVVSISNGVDEGFISHALYKQKLERYKGFLVNKKTIRLLYLSNLMIEKGFDNL